MRRIVHLSDLHFGKDELKRVEPLRELINTINPDLIVLSGDFTQRAKPIEFQRAQEFIKSLERPVFVVPGNHDVPLYNIFYRFLAPFRRYKKYISHDLAPFYADDEIAILGINSARSFAISSGRISAYQIDAIEKNIQTLNPSLTKIVVCHHPFDLPHTKNTHHNYTHKVVGRSKMAMDRLSKLGIDVFLSGHFHIHHIGDTTFRYKIKDYCALIIQAGTAISKRLRGEPVSFNVLHIEKETISIDHYTGSHNNEFYILGTQETFTKTREGWRRLALTTN